MRESELENIICENLPDFFWEHTTLIGRQLRLPHGILDILAWSGPNTCWYNKPILIELKMNALQEKDLGQLLRYMGDIRSWLETFGPYYNSGPLGEISNNRFRSRNPQDPALLGFLIGSSADDKLRAAATGAGVSIGLWKVEDGRLVIHPSNTFEKTRPPSWFNKISQAIQMECIYDLFRGGHPSVIEKHCLDLTIRKAKEMD